MEPRDCAECGNPLPPLTRHQARTLVCSETCRRARRSRMRGRDPAGAACSECGGPTPTPVDGQKGAPPKTCGPECFRIRNTRLKREKREATKPRAICLDCGAKIEHAPRLRQRCEVCAAKRRRRLAQERDARRREQGVMRQRPAPSPVDPRRRLDNRLRSMYGISLAEFEAMAETQGGLCAICRRSPVGRGKGDLLVVDHCHGRGHVRGLLCGNCNIAIGLLCDDPEIVEAAAAYLRRGSEMATVGGA